MILLSSNCRIIYEFEIFALIWCLHLTDPTTYILDRNDPQFDKMHHIRGLIERMRQTYKRLWNVGPFITIDESMVWYKGKYCSARQYMPKKSIKWGLKVWCVVDANSKFIFDFDVYYGKNMHSL